MSPNPPEFVEHLASAGYHSRSNKHSNALAQIIVDDLLQNCRPMADRAAEGRLVYELNFPLRTGTIDWNVDLVFGVPELGPPSRPAEGRIARRSPSVVQIAIEIKSVMTEHRKAVKNRKRDLEAHHEHVHNYDQNAIAGGVLVVNAAATFQSPLRTSPTTHRDPKRLVAHCLNEFRSITSSGPTSRWGLDAKCAIVIDMDNVQLSHTRYVTTPPAPSVGDPIHYDAFIRTIGDHYARRFP